MAVFTVLFTTSVTMVAACRERCLQNAEHISATAPAGPAAMACHGSGTPEPDRKSPSPGTGSCFHEAASGGIVTPFAAVPDASPVFMPLILAVPPVMGNALSPAVPLRPHAAAPPGGSPGILLSTIVITC